MKPQKKPTKGFLTKKVKPIQELRQAMFIPPAPSRAEVRSGVVPEAQIGDEKRQHTIHGRSNTMESVLGEQINKGIARKAEIINGKVEYVAEDVKRYTFNGWKENIILDHTELINYFGDGNMTNVQERPECDDSDFGNLGIFGKVCPQRKGKSSKLPKKGSTFELLA
ncbi:hypothetical protein HYFRA_00008249 [Hymenoscyphus fraxineus]|uniref:Uncharacterized protein n=1 Tax=Hymenoscyphus fraxineus TaxID=746836 RepID=A0A9N9PN87_9HELO|nr:hypothetical protein HYFRA_00008249 [Hymenoscyphus fraxineus]